MMIIKRLKEVYKWNELYLKKNYDYGYFLQVQYDFLDKMVEGFETRNRHEDVANTISEIRKAQVVLKRLLDDNYWMARDYLEGEKQKNRDMELYTEILKEYMWGWWD